MIDPIRLFTTPEAAKYLNVSARTLQKWRQTGGGPMYVKIGGAVRYPQSSFDQFLAVSARHNTSGVA
jgi:excisionase family DNA binding protein